MRSAAEIGSSFLRTFWLSGTGWNCLKYIRTKPWKMHQKHSGVHWHCPWLSDIWDVEGLKWWFVLWSSPDLDGSICLTESEYKIERLHNMMEHVTLWKFPLRKRWTFLSNEHFLILGGWFFLAISEFYYRATETFNTSYLGSPEKIDRQQSSCLARYFFINRTK